MKANFPAGISIVKIDEQRCIIPDSSEARVCKWRVNVGKKITGSTKQRKFFDTYKDAKEFADNAAAARKEKGREALLLNAAQMHEALECVTKLREVGATLTDAKNFYLRHHRPGHLTRTFAQVAAEVLRVKRKNNRRRSTIRAYAGCYRRFNADHTGTPINRITQRNIEAWLDDRDMGPQTRRNYLRDLGVLWNFAVKKGYLAECEPEKIEKPAIDECPTEILSPAQAKALLFEAKKKENLVWLPYFAISLFAGLRTNEMLQLWWEQIDLDQSIITVTPSQSKTRRRRIVGISDNLAAWLKVPKSRTGRLVSYEGNEFWDRREALREAAGMTEWPRNVLRHSFGSYHLAKHNNEGLTAAQMGNSPGVVVRNYREMVKPKDAELYWTL
jgi:integrase